jgi:hypothetical protein
MGHAAAEAVLALKSIYDKPFRSKSMLFRFAVAIAEDTPGRAVEILVSSALQRPKEGGETGPADH